MHTIVDILMIALGTMTGVILSRRLRKKAVQNAFIENNKTTSEVRAALYRVGLIATEVDSVMLEMRRMRIAFFKQVK